MKLELTKDNTLKITLEEEELPAFARLIKVLRSDKLYWDEKMFEHNAMWAKLSKGKEV